MDPSISVDRIEEAALVVDPLFLNSPQFECAELSSRTGVATILKVESTNPIRSFKGRGSDYLLHRLGDGVRPIVCATAGNFGQGMAYACRKRGVSIAVFAPQAANPTNLDRMRILGASIELVAGDFDQAKDAARRHADKTGQLFIEDGLVGAIAEGAGTIGLELAATTDPPDAVFVPLGNGSLVNGVGTWLKHSSPGTEVIAVCARDAPAMALSFEARKPVEAPSTTIAAGISVRVPIPEAVATMRDTVDEVVLVSDDEMIAAMRVLHSDAGLVVEPAGAAGVAAIAKLAERFAGMRVAAILTGGNVTERQMREWIYPPEAPIGIADPRSRSAR